MAWATAVLVRTVAATGTSRTSVTSRAVRARSGSSTTMTASYDPAWSCRAVRAR
jgi:hypothetical protein